MATSDFQKGINDCKAGIYDKFYRYNRNDDGYLYDKGWQFQNLETQNESVVFI